MGTAVRTSPPSTTMNSFLVVALAALVDSKVTPSSLTTSRTTKEPHSDPVLLASPPSDNLARSRTITSTKIMLITTVISSRVNHSRKINETPSIPMHSSKTVEIVSKKITSNRILTTVSKQPTHSRVPIAFHDPTLISLIPTIASKLILLNSRPPIGSQTLETDSEQPIISLILTTDSSPTINRAVLSRLSTTDRTLLHVSSLMPIKESLDPSSRMLITRRTLTINSNQTTSKLPQVAHRLTSTNRTLTTASRRTLSSRPSLFNDLVHPLSLPATLSMEPSSL